MRRGLTDEEWDAAAAAERVQLRVDRFARCDGKIHAWEIGVNDGDPCACGAYVYLRDTDGTVTIEPL